MAKLQVDKEAVNHQSRFKTSVLHLHDSSTPIRPSPTQSNQIQPNPTTPPPPGKEIGKETVNFLAVFDHRLRRPVLSPFSRLSPVKSPGLGIRLFPCFHFRVRRNHP